MKRLRKTVLACSLGGALSCASPVNAEVIESCSDALVKSTYQRTDMENLDWRLARFLSEASYNELKRAGRADLKLFSLVAGANYDDFQKQIREQSRADSQSLSRDQFANVLWTGLDPVAESAYTQCMRAKIFSRKRFNIAVRFATPTEIALWISWIDPQGDASARLSWQYAANGSNRLPTTIRQGEHIVILPRPSASTILTANYKGNAEALVLEPLPAAPTVRPRQYVQTTEIYESPEASGFGKAFGAPVTVCSPDHPGWTIVKVEHLLSSQTERGVCGRWTTCTGAELDTATRACRVITVQGHEHNAYSGYGRAVSKLLVTWNRPVE